MTLTSAQTAINTGFGIVGSLLGRPYNWYRPTTINNPVSSATVMGQLNAQFDVDPLFSTIRSSPPDKPIVYGAFNAALTLPGDYLVRTDNGQTYYIATQLDLEAPTCVYCNNVISFYRPSSEVISSGSGYNQSYTYEGNTANNGKGDPLALSWPASVLQGPKGEKSISDLPNDSRSPWVAVMIPNIQGLLIRKDDQFFDKNGLRYIVSNVISTYHGQKITAEESEI